VITCFEQWNELSIQRQWELFRAMQALAEISERLYEHELNTASTMPKEHCEAHLEGRMRLRSMFHREVERMIETRDGGAK